MHTVHLKATLLYSPRSIDLRDKHFLEKGMKLLRYPLSLTFTGKVTLILLVRPNFTVVSQEMKIFTVVSQEMKIFMSLS